MENITQATNTQALSIEILTGKTILITDDDEITREMIKMYAELWGMTCLEAANGLEAIKLLIDQGLKVDLILMDMRMPGLGGIETTQTLRKSHLLQAIPILALTSDSDAKSMEAAAKAGMVDFITKPFDAHVLQNKLCQQLTSIATI